MGWETELDKSVSDYLPDLTYRMEEPMNAHTSFRIGGAAKRYAQPERGEQLILLLDFAERAGGRPLVIGKGTNLLVSDAGLDRLAVDTTGMKNIQIDGVTLTADAGVSLTRLAETACQQGLSGLEFAHGIPGTVGGGVCMNAGAYDGELRQVITSVTALFPEEGIRTLSPEELDFGYRHSLFSSHPDAVVLRAAVRLTPDDPAAIRERMQNLMARRKSSQPLEFPSAGSTFKRPAGHFAGTLIDQCGLKGLQVGGAQVSEKHAGFIINRGGATCADVLALMRQVQERVQEQTGVRLEPEVRIVEA